MNTGTQPLDLRIGDRIDLGGSRRNVVVVALPNLTANGNVQIAYREYGFSGRLGFYFAKPNPSGQFSNVPFVAESI